MRADLQSLSVKIMEAELVAETGDLRRRFMVARQHVDATGAGLQNPAALFKTPGPVHQISGRKVVVGFGGD